jgi:hypothetical protein
MGGIAYLATRKNPINLKIRKKPVGVIIAIKM